VGLFTGEQMYQFIKNNPIGRRLGFAIFLAMVNFSPVVNAQYQDPLETSAVNMPMAKYSLLLDITRAGKRLLAVGERGHILYSNDSGLNWQQANVPVQTQLNALSFVDQYHGWAVGEDAVILHTQDGGLTWNKQFDDRDGDALGPLMDVLFLNKKVGMAVGVFNKMYRTTDGGNNWQPWMSHVDNEDEWHLFSIAATSQQDIYIASEAGLIFYSNDGGVNFKAWQTDHYGTFHGLLTRRNFLDKEQLIIFGVGGKLFVSTDGKENIKEMNTGSQTGLSAGTWLKDGSALLVGGEGVLLKSDTALKTWKLSTVPTGLPLSGVVKIPGANVYVGMGGIQRVEQDYIAGRQE